MLLDFVVCNGGWQELLNKYALSSRPFRCETAAPIQPTLSGGAAAPTTMDPELSLLMANMAQVHLTAAGCGLIGWC